jgi:hypothetical protein
MIRLTLAALSVPLLLACQQGGTAPGTVLATSTRDAQIETCANHVAGQSEVPREQVLTVYERDTADGNGLVKVTVPNGNVFDCEVTPGYEVVSVTLADPEAS